MRLVYRGSVQSSPQPLSEGERLARVFVRMSSLSFGEGRCPEDRGVRTPWQFLLYLLLAFPLSLPAHISTQLPNLIQPVLLNPDTTTLYLGDYFLNPAKIDSITFSPGYKANWNKQETTVQILTGDKTPWLDELKLWSGSEPVTLILKKSLRKFYSFTFNPQGKTYQSVQLAGEMNNWNPKKNNFTFTGGQWKLDIALNPGAYQYQIVVDGKWMLDPSNPDSVDNNNGGFNSLFKTQRDTGKAPRLSELGYDSAHIKIKAENGYFGIFVLWQNRNIKTFWGVKGDNVLTFSIPAEAQKMQRSFIRIYAYNEAGCSHDLLIPLQYGHVLDNPKNLTRADKEAQIIYSVFVDRFFDGDSSNDKPVKSDSVKPKANFYGGDLAGITKKIRSGYFDSLHVNTLWISPILQNPEGAYREFPEPHDWYTGYHGYWPISLTKIDYRFGDDASLKALVGNAHTHNENVLIDLVANHVHEECPLYKQHPDWATKLDLPDGRKNIRLWDECRLTTWFDSFLPTWDFTNKEVIKVEVDSSLLWITKFGIDGFRHDATKHIATTFWRSLTYNIKQIEVAQQKPFYQIGETYGSKELIASYIGSGLLDGQFDFNLYFDARAAFAKDGEGFEKMASTLQQSLDFYGYHNLMGNITGNHDLPRFASLAGGGLSFTEDARKAGWDRDVKVGSDVAYNKLANMVAFIATIPGVPVIYYGDEIGMPGAGDPDNRRMMRFNRLSAKETELKSKVAKLFELRQEHLALTYGDFNLLQVSKNVLVYERSYFKETAIVVFNNSDKTDTVLVSNPDGAVNSFKPQFGGNCIYMFDTPGMGEETLAVCLPAKSFEILFNNKRAKK